jgi:hypothetical protein
MKSKAKSKARKARRARHADPAADGPLMEFRCAGCGVDNRILAPNGHALVLVRDLRALHRAAARMVAAAATVRGA